MAKAYLAGPMTGFPYFNFRAFDIYAAKGRELGWEVFNPAEMDRARGFDETLYPAGDSKQLPEGFLDDCIKVDSDIIINKLDKKAGDAIALMPGWEMSTGARAERALAAWKGLKAVDAVTWLPLDAAPRIIGLAGYAKTGKDTIFGALRGEFERVAFADPLKAKTFAAFPQLQSLAKEVVRPLLVDVGASYRAWDADYWIDQGRLSVAKLRASLPKASICITDVRYVNEVNWIQNELGGVVYRVRRIVDDVEIGPANEEERRSFAAIDSAYPDLPVVWNNWSPRAAGLQVLARFHGLDSAKFRGKDMAPIQVAA